MTPKNKRMLMILSAILLCGYALVGSALYEYTHKYAEDQNKKKLDQLLLNQRALHSYLEDHLKPVIYELKKENKLYPEFFDPKVLSFTYIARNIHDQLNILRSENNITQISYKLATDNPRNPLNQANKDELSILERFRHDPSLKEYSLVMHEGDHHYIYYAIPIEANKDSCMKCHSTPDKAPRELIERYGATAGFGEKVGNLRAMISLKMPFDDELSEANQIFFLVMGILTLFLALLYGVILYFIRKLDDSQQLIEEKNKKLSILAERDSLTGVLNRRSFDNDLMHQINHPTLGLMIYDIDYFKKINDTYGHQTGDKVLRTLSSLIQSHLRDSDRLYRIGGEEFAIITENQAPEDIERVAERLLRIVSEFDFEIGESVHISIGISIRLETDQAASLYKRADDALYQAKNEGRNRYVIR
ncbi:MAG: diguanylate cyclase [Sulfuricurvum sp.]|nr:diguanylate cyclase [Sulfuricurvum sp.]